MHQCNILMLWWCVRTGKLSDMQNSSLVRRLIPTIVATAVDLLYTRA